VLLGGMNKKRRREDIGFVVFVCFHPCHARETVFWAYFPCRPIC
jgi:hypothetical protein